MKSLLSGNEMFIKEIKEFFQGKGFIVKNSWYSEVYRIFSFEVYMESNDQKLYYNTPNFYFEIDYNGELDKESIKLKNAGQVDYCNLDLYLYEIKKVREIFENCLKEKFNY